MGAFQSSNGEARKESLENKESSGKSLCRLWNHTIVLIYAVAEICFRNETLKSKHCINLCRTPTTTRNRLSGIWNPDFAGIRNWSSGIRTRYHNMFELCLYTLPRGLAFAQQIKQIVSESRFDIVFQALARAICLIGSSSIDDSERMCQGSWYRPGRLKIMPHAWTLKLWQSSSLLKLLCKDIARWMHVGGIGKSWPWAHRTASLKPLLRPVCLQR